MTSLKRENEEPRKPEGSHSGFREGAILFTEIMITGVRRVVSDSFSFRYLWEIQEEKISKQLEIGI